MKVLDYTGTSHLVSKTKTELAKKVDKVTGKGLSTNDYTNAEKQKVADSLTDAPSDGKQYARQDGDWEELDLDGKANIDGYYDTLSVGLADNLIDRKGNGTPQEISYRTSCGDDSIADDGNGIIQSIFGKTVVWNQLVKTQYTCIDRGITTTKNATTNVYTSVGTPTTSYFAVFSSSETTVGNGFSFLQEQSKANHMFLIHVHIIANRGDEAKRFGLLNRTGSTTIDGNDIWFSTTNTNTSLATYFGVERGVSSSSNIDMDYTVRCFDLTQLFGSGNEPTTVDDPRIEWIKQYATAHPEYNSGELISYNGSEIKTVGFNQFDKNGANTINGYFLDSNQPIVASSSRKIVYIPCFPNTKYCARKMAMLTDERLAIGYTNETPQVGSTVYAVRFATYAQTIGNVMTIETTTGADAKYLVVWASWDASTWEQVKETLNINLSWSGYRNGEYEPYWSRTLALPISTYFPDGMKSAGSVRDEMTKDKAVKRIGKVDLGTLTWAVNGNYFQSSIVSDLKTVPSSVTANLICDIYQPIALSPMGDSSEKRIAVKGDGMFFVRDSAYTSATAFKTAMNGVMLYYELATPTETTITPPLDLTYKVADFGTEESIAEGKSTPFNGIIKYSDDFTRGLVNMPKNYDTTASLDALATSLSTMLTSALDGTVTITRGAYDSTNKKYAWNCTFTPNA